MAVGIFDIVTIDVDEAGTRTERRVHLNNPDGAFHIKEWNPSAPPPEDLFASSPFEDGRVIAMRKYGNTAEEITLTVADCEIDDELSALRSILKKAVDYWTNDWIMEPVWIECMGDNDTQILYAYIYGWDVPQEVNPFSPPRSGPDKPMIDDLKCMLEHGFWMDTLDGNCIPTSNLKTVDKYASGDYTGGRSEDDCQVAFGAGTISLISTVGLIGNWTAETYGCGFRFQNVAIPKNAVIISAVLEFECYASLATNTVNVDIYGEDADNSNFFSTFADYQARTRTGAGVLWNAVSAWTVNTHYHTPQITAIVQEIVNRAGWASGNAMTFFVEDNVSSADARRSIAMYDHATATEPHLKVFWLDGSTRTLGQPATCNNPVYFSDRHNTEQLTHGFYYDASATTYSGNLITGVVPLALFPAVPAANDVLYFGIVTSRPFGSILFDLSIADAMMSGTWQYWNGAWTAISTINDFTNQFRITGANVVCWQQPNDWAPTMINGVTALWVRFLVSGVGAGCPTQQNFTPFAIITPYLDIASTAVGGDVAMLCELNLYQSVNAINRARCGNVIAGLRTLKRGADFSAYLNFADEQNPTDVSASLGFGGSFVDDMTSETGRSGYWNFASTNWETMGYITIYHPTSQQYSGSFMVYLRMRLTADSSQYQFKFRVMVGGAYFYESINAQPQESVFGADRITVASLGEMILPIDPKQALGEILITVMGKTTNAANDAYLQTFIMIPNDEWIGNYIASDHNFVYIDPRHLNVDPISQIKLADVAAVRDGSDIADFYWEDRSPHFPKLWERNAQRLWLFHPGYWSGGTQPLMAHPGNTGSVLINAIKKYFMGWSP